MGSYYTSCHRCGDEISGRYDPETDGEDSPGDEYAQVKASRAEHEEVCPCRKYEKALQAAEDLARVVEDWQDPCSDTVRDDVFDALRAYRAKHPRTT